MGLPYLAWNCFSVPRNPGIRKSKRDHRSRTLFWMGVPDKIKRWLQTNCLTALESWNQRRTTFNSGIQFKLCMQKWSFYVGKEVVYVQCIIMHVNNYAFLKYYKKYIKYPFEILKFTKRMSEQGKNSPILQTYFGLAIFYDVSFIQNTVVPADGTEKVNVIPHHVVWRYNQIVLLHLLLNSKIKQTSELILSVHLQNSFQMLPCKVHVRSCVHFNCNSFFRKIVSLQIFNIIKFYSLSITN